MKRRKDLERVEESFTSNYIANLLIPVITVMQRAGELFFKLIEAGGTAIKGRADGVELTSRLVVDETSSYSLTKTEDRVGIPYDYALEHGKPFADQAGAMSVKKTLKDSYEVDAATLHLGGSGHIDVTATHSHSLLGAIDATVESMNLVAGKTYFVTNRTTYKRITKKAEILERLKSTGVIPQDGKIVRGIKPSVMAEVLEVDEVIVGDNEFWNVGGAHDGKACLVKVAPEGLSLADLLMKPYGNVKLRLNEGAAETPFKISAWDNDPKTMHQYDAKGYDSVETLNAECLVKFSLITNQ